MAFDQGLTNQLDVGANQQGWDAVIDGNKDAMQKQYKTYEIIGDGAGATPATPERVTIQVQDGEGAVVVAASGPYFLRVRVVNNNGYLDATNATIAVAGSTTVEQTISATKDLVISSDNDGEFLIDITNATAEQIQLLIGSAPLRSDWAHYNNGFDKTFA